MCIVVFLPMPAAPGVPNFLFLPISTVPGCDDQCRICGLLYFYICQAVTTCAGLWIVIFLPMPAVTTCAGYAESYISTYASCASGASVVFLTMQTVLGCDDLCRVCMQSDLSGRNITSCINSTGRHSWHR